MGSARTAAEVTERVDALLGVLNADPLLLALAGHATPAVHFQALGPVRRPTIGIQGFSRLPELQVTVLWDKWVGAPDPVEQERFVSAMRVALRPAGLRNAGLEVLTAEWREVRVNVLASNPWRRDFELRLQ